MCRMRVTQGCPFHKGLRKGTVLAYQHILQFLIIDFQKSYNIWANKFRHAEGKYLLQEIVRPSSLKKRRSIDMTQKEIILQTQEIQKTIRGTTYHVSSYLSPTAKEDAMTKIVRLMLHDDSFSSIMPSTTTIATAPEKGVPND